MSKPAEAEDCLRNMALFVSYHEVDRLELVQLVDDFRERLKALGAELRVAKFQDYDSNCQKK